MERNKLKILLLLGVLLVSGFSLTSLTSYYSAHDSLSDQISHTALPLTSDNIYSEVQRDLLLPIQISAAMAHNSFLQDWAKEGERTPQEMVQYLSTIQSRFKTITSFFVSEKTRKYYHSSGVLKTIETSDPQDDWYQNFLNSQRVYELNPDYDTAAPDKLVVFINHRVEDENGKLLGVTGVGLALDQIQQQIFDYQARYGGQITFIDSSGNITLTTQTSYLGQSLRDIDKYQTDYANIMAHTINHFILEAGGRERFLVTRKLPELDWTLMVEQDANSQDGQIVRSLISNLAVSLGICALVLVGGYLTLQRYQNRLEEIAMTDKLTGASNRHVFQPIFDQITKNAARTKTPVSLALIDIDHFKKINDTYGHHAGDMALLLVVDVIKHRLRESDTICRWGGEEFLIILPNCSAQMAAQLCETIRYELEQQPLTYNDQKIPLTASIGLSEYKAVETATNLIKRIDKALYQSKESGRNQITVV